MTEVGNGASATNSTDGPGHPPASETACAALRAHPLDETCHPCCSGSQSDREGLLLVVPRLR
jgi:hypothetical protein